MARAVLTFSLLWLAYVIAHELFTGKIWFWVLPGMSPPILFATIPLFLLIVCVFLPGFKVRVAAVAIITFGISYQSSGINLSALFSATIAPGNAPELHIVQMNTDYWGQLRNGILTDPRDKDAMLDYLRDLDADIYLLQEHMQRDGAFAPPITDLTDVKEVFPEYSAITAGTLLTLTRLPVVSQSVVNPDTDADIHLPPPPYVLQVDMKVGSNIISTYNVHMPIQIIIEKNWFSRDFFFEIWRRHFIRQNEYQVLTSDVAGNQNPLVVAGDFNTSPAMGDNRQLLKITRDAANFGQSLYPSTWRVGGQLPRLWRNDWFLIRNDIGVISFQSLNPEGNSDHLVQSVHLVVETPEI